MVPTLPAEVSLTHLHSLTLGDLVGLADREGDDAVGEFLERALGVATSFLSVHGKVIHQPPAIRYDQYESGVSYDPLHADGEVLICGGPSGVRRGGEDVLADRYGFVQPSLLTILARGLLHSYDFQLCESSDVHPGGRRGEVTAGIEPFGRYGLPAPAVDHGFTTLFDVYLEADITDRSLREAVIEAWAEWFDLRTDVHVPTYRAVATTVSSRIEGATGDPRERLCHGLAIQEPLLGGGNVGVLAGA